jgi:hypothetical protein
MGNYDIIQRTFTPYPVGKESMGIDLAFAGGSNACLAQKVGNPLAPQDTSSSLVLVL